MKDVFVLMTNFGSLRGVYTSKKMLKAGVNYWAGRNPTDTLVYQAYMPNYLPGNLDTCNKFAYLGEGAYFGGIMDNVPRGVNLIDRTDIDILNKINKQGLKACQLKM